MVAYTIKRISEGVQVDYSRQRDSARANPNWPFQRKLFLAQGYAWLDVDVRGTGASFGHRAYPWSPDEIRDGAEVIDWIVRQPWSNGKVGAIGTSYDGGAAD